MSENRPFFTIKQKHTAEIINKKSGEGNLHATVAMVISNQEVLKNQLDAILDNLNDLAKKLL